MSTAEKLTYLNNTKQLLKENINNLGGNLTNEPFRQYASVLEGIYERLPKVSGIGASLSLSPSLRGKIKLNEIQGDTLQDSQPTPDTPVPIQSVTGLQNVEVCGKNLINGLLDNSTTGKKLERTINADENFYLYIKTNNTTSDRCYAFLDSTNVGTIWVSNNNGTLTFSGSRNFAFNRIRIQDNTTVSENMLTLGSTATTYEPYKGNTYEVNLGNIELNKIGTYEDSIKKSTGKNLFDKNNADIIESYFDYSNVGLLKSANGNKTLIIECKPNTTYTVSKIASTRFRIGCNNERITTGQVNSAVYGSSSDTSLAITTGANDKYLYVFYWVSSDTLTEQTILDSIMINEGSTALPYEPYGKVWYIEKKTGKVVLNGSETWNLASTYTNNSRFVGDNVVLGTTTSLLSNYFVEGSGGTDTTNIDTNGSSGKLMITIPNSIATTSSALTTWLTSHNTTVLYQLSTPTYATITNTELIEQLETLYNAKSKDGTTNINVTSEDLSMILNVGVLKGDAE